MTIEIGFGTDVHVLGPSMFGGHRKGPCKSEVLRQSRFINPKSSLQLIQGLSV